MLMFRLALLCILLATYINGNTSAQTFSCLNTLESRLVIGEQAQVIAEGGSNLRRLPSTTANLLTVIPQNERIPVIDGPFCAEGYAWWQVDYDNERGWIAEGLGEFYWLAPYVIQRAQIGNVRIEIQPNLVDGIQLERLSEPPRSQFVLEGFPVSSNQITPFIVIFDQVPDDVFLDELETNTSAQEQTLEDGQRFVDILFTEPIAETEEITLVYRFVSITEDNRFIDAYFPILAPELPLVYDTENNGPSYEEDYFEETSITLDTLNEDEFTPTLSQLDGIVRSIQVNAPPEESIVLPFTTSGISLEYNPLLTTHIVEQLVAATETLPRHIRLLFSNYPSENPAYIRIFNTEEISGTVLTNFQQTLSRQPSNPPQIPVLSQNIEPLFREELQYLSFTNGEGVRYLTSFIEGETLYSFQGLSNDDNYFISALFPVDDNIPSLIILDLLMQSLQVGG